MVRLVKAAEAGVIPPSSSVWKDMPDFALMMPGIAANTYSTTPDVGEGSKIASAHTHCTSNGVSPQIRCLAGKQVPKIPT